MRGVSLIELQRRFYHTITDDGVEAQAAWPDKLHPGLKVYRTAYRARLIECLQGCFEKSWSWIGDDRFGAATMEHIRRNPPRSWTLDDAGRGFSQTLAALNPDDPEVEELAWLEWEMQQAFTGEDASALIGADFARTTAGFAEPEWMNLRLSFVPSLVTGTVRTDCAAIWNAIERGEGMPDTILLANDATIAVWREEMRPRFRMLGSDEAAGLAMMRGGASFGMLCEAMIDLRGDEDGAAAAGWMLARWVADSMISAP